MTGAASFLAGTDWAEAQSHPLAKDASVRMYRRLTRQDGEVAILAEDPSEVSRAAFVTLSGHLLSLGLSPPKVLKFDAASQFMLLEDLGDGLYPSVITKSPELENSLYSAAIEAILIITGAPPPAVMPFGAAEMAQQVAEVLPFYTGVTQTEIEPRLAEFLHGASSPPNALMLRDVHAGNLLWLPERSGAARVGLLDFQDARLASPLYDIVSLLTDARRDIPAPMTRSMLTRVADQWGRSLSAIEDEFAALSLQRNLRILGVFARLCARDGRPDYLPYMPRVWGHIDHALGRINDQDLSSMLAKVLPAPTEALLNALEAKCALPQTH